MLILTGCSTFTINGTLDPVETATIRVAVGLAMTAEPKTIVPAYAVSTALLAILDGTEITTLGVLCPAVDEEIDKLNLTDAERASFMELVELVKASIIQQLDLPDMDVAQKIVIIKGIVQIVRDASIARI